jgi:aspartate-semialdehyde dehydrogenase
MGFEFGEGYEVAIIGATGCLGRELVQQIGNVIPIRKLHLFASLASQSEYVDVDGDSIVVHGLREEGIASEIRSSLHMAFLCCSKDKAVKLGTELSEEGIAVVDLTGGLGTSIGYSLAGLADHEDDFQSHRMISLPSPSTAGLARVWEALHGFQPIQLTASVTVSASKFGQKGVEELAKQVRGLLNFQDAPQAVFPEGLAFDILPMVGDVEDATALEEGMSQALADLTLLEAHRFRHRVQVAPIFSGVSMCVQISLTSNPTLEEVVEVLSKSESIEFCSQLPTLRNSIGPADVLVGRVSMNPWVQGVELQVQLDNVAFAVHNALTLVQRFIAMDMI